MVGLEKMDYSAANTDKLRSFQSRKWRETAMKIGKMIDIRVYIKAQTSGHIDLKA